MGVMLSFVPEDRLGMGLVGNMDLTNNMLLRSFRHGKGMFTDRKTPRRLAASCCQGAQGEHAGACPHRCGSSPAATCRRCWSGVRYRPRRPCLMTAYAVRGLDINSSYTIYDLINQQKEKGVAVIFVGEDLDVLLGAVR